MRNLLKTWVICGVILACLSGVLGMAGAQTASPDELTFQIRQVRWDGATVLTEDDLQYLAQGVIDRNITADDLVELADRVTLFYRQNGYPFAYAYVPPQEIEDGTVVLAVVEGRYGEITVDNSSALRDSTASRFLRSVKEGRLIESSSLNHTLVQLSSVPGLAVSSTFRTGSSPGTADLHLTLSDARRLWGTVTADNHGSAYTGRARLSVTTEFANAMGFGDVLSASVLTSGQALVNARLSMTVPIPDDHNMHRLGFSYAGTTYQLKDAFALLESEGSASTVRLWTEQQVQLADNGKIHTVSSFESKSLSDSVLGATTDRKIHAMRLEVTRQSAPSPVVTFFTLKAAGGVLAIHDTTVAQNDAVTAKTAGPFLTLGAALVHTRPVLGDLTASVTLSAQWSTRNLHSSEKFSLGGPGGVRAYSGNDVSGDEGWLVRLALDKPLPGLHLRAQGFVDAGAVRLNKRPWEPSQPNTRHLYGGGLGLVFQPTEHFNVTVEYGIPLGKPGTAIGDGQLWARGTYRF